MKSASAHPASQARLILSWILLMSTCAAPLLLAAPGALVDLFAFASLGSTLGSNLPLLLKEKSFEAVKRLASITVGSCAWSVCAAIPLVAAYLIQFMFNQTPYLLILPLNSLVLLTGCLISCQLFGIEDENTSAATLRNVPSLIALCAALTPTIATSLRLQRPLFFFAAIMSCIVPALFLNCKSQEHGKDRPSGIDVEAQVALPADLAASLTKRELQVALAICNGMTAKDAAAKLGIKPSTAREYLQRSYRKLKIGSIHELRELAQTGTQHIKKTTGAASKLNVFPLCPPNLSMRCIPKQKSLKLPIKRMSIALVLAPIMFVTWNQSTLLCAALAALSAASSSKTAKRSIGHKARIDSIIIQLGFIGGCSLSIASLVPMAIGPSMLVPALLFMLSTCVTAVCVFTPRMDIKRSIFPCLSLAALLAITLFACLQISTRLLVGILSGLFILSLEGLAVRLTSLSAADKIHSSTSSSLVALGTGAIFCHLVCRLIPQSPSSLSSLLLSVEKPVIPTSLLLLLAIGLFMGIGLFALYRASEESRLIRQEQTSQIISNESARTFLSSQNLSTFQLEVGVRTFAGMQTAQIAEELHYAQSSVRAARSRCFQSVKAHDIRSFQVAITQAIRCSHGKNEE